MPSYTATEQDVKDQVIHLDSHILKYSGFFSIFYNGVLLHPGFGTYEVSNNALNVSKLGPVRLGDELTVEAYINALLFDKIYTCSKAELANYLISADLAERQLAEIRNKQLHEQELMIREIVKEQLDASFATYAGNRNP